MLCGVCVGVGYGCCVVCVMVWDMGVVWCVCGCGVWVLCGVCFGVGYGCCVVCVWVWGMGVVWCVCRCGIWVLCGVCVGVGYGYVRMCMGNVWVSWICICMLVPVYPCISLLLFRSVSKDLIHVSTYI